MQADGPYGGYVFSLAVTSNALGSPVMYAGAFGSGVFRSEDLGANWERSNNGIIYGYTLSVVAKGDTVLAGTRAAGMYRSIDGGQSWEEVTNGLYSNDIINSVAVVNSQSAQPIFFAAVAGVSVHRSSDGGASWFPTGSPPCLTVTQIHVVSRIVGLQPVLVGNFPDGIYFSTDLGQSWTISNNGLGDLNIWAFASYTSNDGTTRVFASANDSLIYACSDMGQNWIPTSLRAMTRSLLVAPAPGSTTYLFAGTLSDGVFRSSDNGLSWARQANGLPYEDIRAFAVWDSVVFACPFGGGVFQSHNLGGQWASSSNGFTNLEARAIVRNPRSVNSQLFAGTWGGGVFKSNDGGLAWTPVHESLQNKYVLSLSFDDSSLYVGTWGQGGVYSSTDEGQSWSSSGLKGHTIWAIASLGQYTFAGSSDSGIFRSTNRGGSWVTVNSGLNENAVIGSLFVDGPVLYAGALGEPCGIYRSIDSGGTWTAVGPPGQDVVAFAGGGGNDLYAGTSRIGEGILRSGDNGLTWFSVSPPSAYVQGLCVFDEHIFAATRDSGVFWSSDGGTGWSQVNTGLPVVRDVKTVFEVDGYLLAGTGFDAIWRRPLTEIITSVNEVAPFTPRVFFLSQNYPNPFNPATLISYTLPTAQHVRVTVFDLLGREVATVTDELQPPGSHTVEFQSSGLSTGVYLYRIVAGPHTATRKMIVLR